MKFNSQYGNHKSVIDAHVQTGDSQPCRSIRLTQSATSWQGFWAIEAANIIQTQGSTLEDVVPSMILSDNPLEEKSNRIKLNRKKKTN